MQLCESTRTQLIKKNWPRIGEEENRKKKKQLTSRNSTTEDLFGIHYRQGWVPHCLISSQQLPSDVAAPVWVGEASQPRQTRSHPPARHLSPTLCLHVLSFPPRLPLMCWVTDRSDGKTELCGEMGPNVPERPVAGKSLRLRFLNVKPGERSRLFLFYRINT